MTTKRHKGKDLYLNAIQVEKLIKKVAEEQLESE